MNGGSVFNTNILLYVQLPLLVVSSERITTAIEIEDQHGISFWDALIVAAAESADVEVLYTEDFNDGQSYGAVVARNPFK